MSYLFDGSPLADLYPAGSVSFAPGGYTGLTSGTSSSLAFEQTTTGSKYTVTVGGITYDLLDYYNIMADYTDSNNSTSLTVPAWCKSVRFIGVGGGGGGGGGGCGAFSGNAIGADDANEGGNGGAGSGGQYLTTSGATGIAVTPGSTISIVIGTGGGGGAGGLGGGDKDGNRQPGTDGTPGNSTTINVSGTTYTASGGRGGGGGYGSYWGDGTNQPADAAPGTTPNGATAGVDRNGTNTTAVVASGSRPAISGGTGANAFTGDISDTNPTEQSSGGRGTSNDYPQSYRDGVPGGSGTKGFSRVYFIP